MHTYVAAPVAANTPTAAWAVDVQTCINPTFCVWSCCLVKKMYFTLISLSTQWGPKAHTPLYCILSGGPEAHTFS